MTDEQRRIAAAGGPTGHDPASGAAPLLTVKDVARMTQTSERTVWRWIEAGQLRAYKLGRQYRIADGELARFFECSRVQQAETDRGSPMEREVERVLPSLIGRRR